MTYEIRLIETGAIIDCLRKEGTFGLSFDNKIVTPGPNGKGLPCARSVIAEPVQARKWLAEGLGRLPNLPHKLVLVYREDEFMFTCCFLVATEHSDWWRDYKLVGAAAQSCP